MRYWGVIWCLLFVSLEVQTQDAAPYPYHKPEELIPGDYQRLDEDSTPDAFSCQDNFTGLFKMEFHHAEELLDEGDTTIIFRTDRAEWTESDEKALEQRWNQKDQTLLKWIYHENLSTAAEFLFDLHQYRNEFLTAWKKNMCDNKCEKVGDVCDSKVWLHWVDTTDFRCEYRTTLSFLEEGTDSNQVSQVIVPKMIFDGAFYFKHSCECRLADDAISMVEPPWDEIQLTGTYMKPDIPVLVPIIKEKTPLPWWIPVSGWAVAGGATTYLLTQKKNNEPDQEPLILLNDNEIIDCEATSILLDVLRNDQGAEVSILSVDNVIGGEVSIQQNAILVANPTDQLIQFNYTAEDKYGNTSTAEVMVLVNSSSLLAVDDRYETNNFYVEGNLLDNDQGSNIVIVHYEPPPDGNLVIADDGQFSFTPANREAGQTQFQYIIADKCNNQDTAFCLMDINIPPCNILSSYESTLADCGRANGNAVISITPQDDYQYLWTDGSTLAMRNDLAAGVYDVVVSTDFCGDTISIEIGEIPAKYDLQGVGVPGNCVEGGDIDLSFDQSLDGDLMFSLTGPSGVNEYATSEGTAVSLSEYTKVLPGSYTVEVWNALSGRSCSQSVEILVPDNTPELIANNDALSTSFMTPIEFNTLTNDMGLSLAMTGIKEPLGGQVVSSEDGQVVFTPEDGFSGEASFQYSVTDGCGRVEEGQVIVMVEAPDCNWTTDVTVENANCGRADGSASIIVSPERDYEFLWPDGSILPERIDLAPGVYAVTISSEYCKDTVSIEILEETSDYKLQGIGVPGNCVEGGDIDLTYDHSLDGELVVAVTGPSGSGEFTTNEKSGISLSDFVTVLPGSYTVEIWNIHSGRSCSQFVEVTVPDNTPELIAKSDAYSTGYMTPIEFNVLFNDMGQSLALTDIKALIGGTVEYSEDGGVVFTPEDGFSGEASFSYLVFDICGQESEAQVIITVEALDCTMMGNFDTQHASCGQSDGSALITISPAGNYEYVWSNGSVGPELTNVAPGSYSVNVRRVGTTCQNSFEVVIGEKNSDYIDGIQSSPITCLSSGDIIVDLNVPPGEQLVVEVNYPEGVFVFSTNSSQIKLSDHVTIVAGDYLIKVDDSDGEVDCRDEGVAFINDNRRYPLIELVDQSPPSSPDAEDGQVAVQIVGQSVPPYRLFLNGQNVGIFFSGIMSIDQMGYGEHSIYILDINGCKSNVAVVYFEPTGTFQLHIESGFTSSYTKGWEGEVFDENESYVHTVSRLKGIYHKRNQFIALSGGYGIARNKEERILQRYETTFSRGVRKNWLSQTTDIEGGMIWSMVNGQKHTDTGYQQYGVFLGSTLQRNNSSFPLSLLRLNVEVFVYLSTPVYPEFRCSIGF